jgi:hypothetical protein
MLGKYGIFRGKSFEKSVFQEIPRNFFAEKMCEKLAPGSGDLCISVLRYFVEAQNVERQNVKRQKVQIVNPNCRHENVQSLTH